MLLSGNKCALFRKSFGLSWPRAALQLSSSEFVLANHCIFSLAPSVTSPIMYLFLGIINTSQSPLRFPLPTFSLPFFLLWSLLSLALFTYSALLPSSTFPVNVSCPSFTLSSYHYTVFLF